MTTHEHDHSIPSPAGRRAWLSRWFTGPTLAVTALALAMLTLSSGLLWLLTHEHRARVIGETPAGRVLRVQLQGDFFTRSLVETDTGYYALQGAVSLNKGEPVSLQELQGGQGRLCDSQQRCTRLIRPWF